MLFMTLLGRLEAIQLRTKSSAFHVNICLNQAHSTSTWHWNILCALVGLASGNGVGKVLITSSRALRTDGE
jgi:hypothetical protein